MSKNRKTRKEKILAEKRKKELKVSINELTKLKEELERQIKEQEKKNFKELNIRNLKIFTSTCNFLLPFVVSTGVFVGAFKICGGGLPFHVDELDKYRLYNLDYGTKRYVQMNDEYKRNPHLEYNSLIIYSPWEEQDDYYVRFKRVYDIGTLSTLDLFNKVMNDDYAYILANLTKYKEEKQIVNQINNEEDNGYYIEASLHMIDRNDIVKYNETDFRNKLLTIIELILGLGIGGAIAIFRDDFDYSYELYRINNTYHLNVKAIEPMQKKLIETNKQILSLTKKKGGNI